MWKNLEDIGYKNENTLVPSRKWQKLLSEQTFSKEMPKVSSRNGIGKEKTEKEKGDEKWWYSPKIVDETRSHESSFHRALGTLCKGVIFTHQISNLCQIKEIPCNVYAINVGYIWKLSTRVDEKLFIL